MFRRSAPCSARSEEQARGRGPQSRSNNLANRAIKRRILNRESALRPLTVRKHSVVGRIRGSESAALWPGWLGNAPKLRVSESAQKTTSVLTWKSDLLCPV